jgi:hypothetical protein
VEGSGTHGRWQVDEEMGKGPPGLKSGEGHTHISDHIHEWRRRRRLIKLELPDQLLAEWFTKSFVNEIGKDIAMGGIVMKEQAISRAQYLDLVYSQMGTLYDLLPELPHPNSSSTSTTPAASHAADGVIGTAQAPITFCFKHKP